MPGLLTAEVQTQIARKQGWVFEFYAGLGTQDGFLLPGDGVDDLDQLLARLAQPLARGSYLKVDCGLKEPSFRLCDRLDVQAIREAFVALYGEANRLPVR